MKLYSSPVMSPGRTSIPIRCIVERITGPGTDVNANKGSSAGGNVGVGSVGGGVEVDGSNSRGNSCSPLSGSVTQSNIGTTGIRSAVETLRDLSTDSNCSPGPSSMGSLSSSSVIEQDTFAIIAPGVLFSNIVRTALIRLGYSASEIVGAKGYIQFRNWKLLTFDQITDSNDVTVEDIMSDIHSCAILRIILSRPRTNTSNELKDKLLPLLLAHYSLLVNSGCQIDQSLLAAICERGINPNSMTDAEITDETFKKLDQWYIQQIFNHYRQMATLAAAQAHQQHQEVAAAVVAAANQQQQNQSPQLSDQQSNSSSQLNLNRRGANCHPLLSLELDTSHSSSNHINSNHSNNLLDHHSTSSTSPSAPTQQYVRTRIRTSFDPELELPKLHRWFSENQHPSRAQIQHYVKELNSLESRRGRKPLDVNNVVYWFKNARAAHKRQELKFLNGSQSPILSNNIGNALLAKEMEEDDNEKIKDFSSESLSKMMRVKTDFDEDDESDDHDDSGRDEMIDDDCSQMSQTLDLSVKPVKRKRSDSSYPNSPLGGVASNLLEGTSTSTPLMISSFSIKEELGTDGEEDEESDLDEKDFYCASSISGNGSNFTLDSPEEGRRARRSRTFIDPMTEVPRLEQWFSTNTHPTHLQIVKYTESLNNLPYRQKFPKLEPKNIQFWFKNRRAKYKRLGLPSTTATTQSTSNPIPVTSSVTSISSSINPPPSVSMVG